MAQKAKTRVFLDTNVWFSGLYSAVSPPSKILQIFLEGHISVVMSQQVLAELTRTFQQKLPQALPQLNNLLSNSQIEIIQDPEAAEIEPLVRFLDFEDAVILAAAISAEVEIFVTGDNHFLKNTGLKRNTGLFIQSPAGFLKSLERNWKN